MPANPHNDRPILQSEPLNDLGATVDRITTDPNATDAFYKTSQAAVPGTPQEPVTLSIGCRFGGNYRLEKQLGRGGMGEAWRAFDETAERSVVLKFVPKEIQHIQAAMDSVRSSFKKAHSLQHQHICPLYGLFTDPGHGLYVVMKFVEGVSLDEFRRRSIQRQGHLPFVDAVNILWATARALDYAHEKKIIHRDIKPQNIMISKIDGVQIIDFGLAEEIRMSMVQYSEVSMDIAGTRPYMAPEQWRGRMQDARTDQYALAATAYELFSGMPPFQGSDLGILRECVLHDEPEWIESVPPAVNNALLRGLAKRRDDRFSDCKSFIKAMVESKRSSAFGLPEEQEDLTAESSAVLHLPPETGIGDPHQPVWLPKSVFGTDTHHVSTKSTGADKTAKNAAPNFPYPDAPYRTDQTPTPLQIQRPMPVIVTNTPSSGKKPPEKNQDTVEQLLRVSSRERAVLYALIIVLIALLIAMAFYLFHLTAPQVPSPLSTPRPKPRAEHRQLRTIFPFPYITPNMLCEAKEAATPRRGHRQSGPKFYTERNNSRCV